MSDTITSIKTSDYTDGKTEFEINVTGSPARCRVDYGDGAHEDLKLPADAVNPVMYCEHAFKPGQFRVTVLLQSGNTVMDRKFKTVVKT